MARRVQPYAPVIRYLRQRQGLTVRELARRLGVPEYYVGYLEDGYRYPRPQQLQALARIFGWSVFELALLADEPIPYPDWPARDDIPGWLSLGAQWGEIVEGIQRYALTRVMFDQPEWLARLRADDPELAEALDRFGLVALYSWVRERWTTVLPPRGRLQPARTLEEALQAVTPPATPAAPPAAATAPAWWSALTSEEQHTVETVARGLLAARSAPPLAED